MPKRLETWQIWHAMRKTIGEVSLWMSLVIVMPGLSECMHKTLDALLIGASIPLKHWPSCLMSWRRVAGVILRNWLSNICSVRIYNEYLRCTDQLKPTVDAELLAVF